MLDMAHAEASLSQYGTKFYTTSTTIGDTMFHKIERLVFVCSGNICRSAFAEAVAKARGFDAISVGVHAIQDVPANDQAIITARAMGYDLSSHRTKPIMYPVLKKTDLLVAMEPWQARLVSEGLFPKHYTTLLGLWGRTKRPYIHDPYMQYEAYFISCFNYIEKSVHAVIDKIQKAN